LNVLIAGQAFFRRDNGQAVFTVNLAHGLAKAGHHVLVIAPSENGTAYCQQINKLTVQTVPTLLLPYNLNVTAFTDALVERVLIMFAPDIVHIQDHYFLSRSVIRVARRYHIPVVGTNHFLPENLTDSLWNPRVLGQAMQKLMWHTMLTVYNTLDAVTTPTQTAVAILQQQQLIPSAINISCGVDASRFHPRPTLDRAAIRQQYGLATAKTMLLYVGRVDREKCIDTIIRALAQLRRTDLQFVIAGKGRYLNALQQLCQRLGLAQQVIFTGFVPDADLPLLLNSADAFVMPSHAELQSIATLEAMASGLPILAANARALPELVEPGSNGWLFAPQNAADAAQQILAWLNARPQWATMGQASLCKVEPHAHVRTIQHYATWYAQTRQATQAKPSIETRRSRTPQWQASLTSLLTQREP